MNGNPSGLFCILPRDDSSRFFPPGTAPVYPNVYDISTINICISWIVIGAFHTGLEGNQTSIFFNHFPPISNSNRSFRLITVHGVEYGFGCHQESESGVFEIEPRKCPGFKLRESILMGTTKLSPSQVQRFIELQSNNYYGDTYHLFGKKEYEGCGDVGGMIERNSYVF